MGEHGSLLASDGTILQLPHLWQKIQSRRSSPTTRQALQPTEQEKLSPKLEGPYLVDKVIRLGIYRLKKLDRTPLP